MYCEKCNLVSSSAAGLVEVASTMGRNGLYVECWAQLPDEGDTDEILAAGFEALSVVIASPHIKLTRIEVIILGPLSAKALCNLLTTPGNNPTYLDFARRESNNNIPETVRKITSLTLTLTLAARRVSTLLSHVE